MDDRLQVVEVSILGGKVFVVFSDHKIASLDADQLRSVAVQFDMLTSIPQEEGFD
jgi:hypothetical protein